MENLEVTPQVLLGRRSAGLGSATVGVWKGPPFKCRTVLTAHQVKGVGQGSGEGDEDDDDVD